MSVDAFLDALGTEARAAVRRLLQQAYDRGYRDGLATTGLPETLVAATPAASPPPVTWSGGAAAGPDDEPDDPDDYDPDDGPEAADEVNADDLLRGLMTRPIRANATVGTLRQRIVRGFDLDRFDIDVVLCRRGDPHRRQLKSSARLALYLREEP